MTAGNTNKSAPLVGAGRLRFTVRIARYAWWAIGIAFAFVLWQVAAGSRPPVDDAHAYWVTSFANPYAITALGAADAYHYAPPFLWLIAPLKALPFDVFRGVWVGLILIALAWMVGLDLLLPALVLAPFANDYQYGNIHILTAAAIVLSFRFPVAWAFPVFTKAAAGIGVLWFAFRGEWRSFWIAAGTCLAIILVSFPFVGDQWIAWFRFLRASGTGSTDGVPLIVKAPVAVVLLWAGARTNRRWVVPLACMVVLPILPFTLSMVAGSIALRRLQVFDDLHPKEFGRRAGGAAKELVARRH